MTSNSWWDGEKFLKEIFSSMGKKDSFHKIEQLVRTTPTNLNEEDIYKIRARGRSVLSMLDQKRKTRTLLFSAIGALLAIAVIISMAIFVIIPAIKANQTPEPTVEPTVAATTPPTQEPTFAPAETPEPTAIPESTYLVTGMTSLMVPAPQQGVKIFNLTGLTSSIFAVPQTTNEPISATCLIAGCKTRSLPKEDSEMIKDGGLSAGWVGNAQGKDKTGTWILIQGTINTDNELAWVKTEEFDLTLEMINALPVVENSYSWDSDIAMDSAVYAIYLLDQPSENPFTFRFGLEQVLEDGNTQAIEDTDLIQVTTTAIETNAQTTDTTTAEAPAPKWAYAGLFTLTEPQRIRVTVSGFVPADQVFDPNLLLVQLPEEMALGEILAAGKVRAILDDQQMGLTVEGITLTTLSPGSAWGGNVTTFTAIENKDFTVEILLPVFTRAETLYFHRTSLDQILPTFTLVNADNETELSLGEQTTSWVKIGDLPENCVDCVLKLVYSLKNGESLNIDAVAFVDSQPE